MVFQKTDIFSTVNLKQDNSDITIHYQGKIEVTMGNRVTNENGEEHLIDENLARNESTTAVFKQNDKKNTNVNEAETHSSNQARRIHDPFPMEDELFPEARSSSLREVYNDRETLEMYCGDDDFVSALISFWVWFLNEGLMVRRVYLMGILLLKILQLNGFIQTTNFGIERDSRPAFIDNLKFRSTEVEANMPTRLGNGLQTLMPVTANEEHPERDPLHCGFGNNESPTGTPGTGQKPNGHATSQNIRSNDQATPCCNVEKELLIDGLKAEERISKQDQPEITQRKEVSMGHDIHDTIPMPEEKGIEMTIHDEGICPQEQPEMPVIDDISIKEPPEDEQALAKTRRRLMESRIPRPIVQGGAVKKTDSSQKAEASKPTDPFRNDDQGHTDDKGSEFQSAKRKNPPGHCGSVSLPGLKTARDLGRVVSNAPTSDERRRTESLKAERGPTKTSVPETSSSNCQDTHVDVDGRSVPPKAYQGQQTSMTDVGLLNIQEEDTLSHKANYKYAAVSVENIGTRFQSPMDISDVEQLTRKDPGLQLQLGEGDKPVQQDGMKFSGVPPTTDRCSGNIWHQQDSWAGYTGLPMKTNMWGYTNGRQMLTSVSGTPLNGNPHDCSSCISELLNRTKNPHKNKTKEKIHYELDPKRYPSPNKNVRGLAEAWLMEDMENWEIDSLIDPANVPLDPHETAVHRILTEMKFHGLKIGHLVFHFYQKANIRRDVLNQIKEIHSDCPYCCKMLQ